MLIAYIVVGERELAQLGHFANMAQGLTRDFVASDIKAFQLLQFYYIRHPVTSDLIMVNEQLPQFLETIANSIKAKICEAVLFEDQRLDAVEVFNDLDILVCDFSMRQIYLICMGSDDQIFDGGSFGPALGVETHHDLLQLIELTL